MAHLDVRQDDFAVEEQDSTRESAQIFSTQDLDHQQLGAFVLRVDLLTFGAIKLLAAWLCCLLFGP